MCSVHRLCEFKGALLFPWFGSGEHISDIKLFGSKISLMFFMWGDFTQVRCLLLIFLLTFSSPCCLRIM